MKVIKQYILKGYFHYVSTNENFPVKFHNRLSIRELGIDRKIDDKFCLLNESAYK